MTNVYTWVQWNRHKKVYDLFVLAGIVGYLAIFFVVGSLVFTPPNAVSPEIMLIRALGTLAIVMLHVILAIGPLARLTDRAAPLLYNRRHLGVTFFLVAVGHGVLTLLYYGGFGVRNPISAMLVGYDSYLSVSGFPFEILGFLALLVFFLMAATSHDFWLANLSPRVWKSLHMLVYVAYGLVVMHVALGALQSERSLLYPALLGAGVVVIGGLHVAAGVREARRDADAVAVTGEWVDVASVDEIPEDRAAIVCLRGAERVAVFRHDGKISAVSNVCVHQAGPLGEGKIVDGCITCPWHGYQYRPEDGRSPPPYTEKIPTYDVRVEGKRVLLNPTPNAPGTPVAPARVSQGGTSDA